MNDDAAETIALLTALSLDRAVQAQGDDFLIDAAIARLLVHVRYSPQKPTERLAYMISGVHDDFVPLSSLAVLETVVSEEFQRHMAEQRAPNRAAAGFLTLQQHLQAWQPDDELQFTEGLRHGLDRCLILGRKVRKRVAAVARQGETTGLLNLVPLRQALGKHFGKNDDAEPSTVSLPDTLQFPRQLRRLARYLHEDVDAIAESILRMLRDDDYELDETDFSIPARDFLMDELIPTVDVFTALAEDVCDFEPYDLGQYLAVLLYGEAEFNVIGLLSNGAYGTEQRKAELFERRLEALFAVNEGDAHETES